MVKYNIFENEPESSLNLYNISRKIRTLFEMICLAYTNCGTVSLTQTKKSYIYPLREEGLNYFFNTF